MMDNDNEREDNDDSVVMNEEIIQQLDAVAAQPPAHGVIVIFIVILTVGTMAGRVVTHIACTGELPDKDVATNGSNKIV